MLIPERQSARKSKITDDVLIESGTGCIAVPIWQQWAPKGCAWQTVAEFLTTAQLVGHKPTEDVQLRGTVNSCLLLYGISGVIGLTVLD